MELRNFINGQFIDSISKKNIDVINPSNQELVGKINIRQIVKYSIENLR